MESTATPTTTGPVYRISWVAYIKPVMLSLLAWLFALGLSQANIWAATALTLIIFGYAVYQVLMLRSVQLYTDADGVWVYRGIFPWNKGVSGVKWRDLEDAVFFPNFLSWALKSYTVRVGHRFTKSSEIVLRNITGGNDAVLHINSAHKQALLNVSDH
jgi:hypothetical protein